MYIIGNRVSWDKMCKVNIGANDVGLVFVVEELLVKP